jgi:hypothetical protein
MRPQVLLCLPQAEEKSKKVTLPVSIAPILNVSVHHPHGFPKPFSSHISAVTPPHDSHFALDKKFHITASKSRRNLLTSSVNSE